MQVVQQYANGMNPEVPPYLALGELQRRELSNKQMAMTQGGQQGTQPSIKEQVEQKAGLMALQQMQQQQMAQQRPQGPMPAPAGVPQPEPQPESMMARGGLASIPVRRDMFEYARGGIIAFAEGGGVEEKYKQESIEMGEGKRTRYSPDVQDYVKAREQESKASYAERERETMRQGNPMMAQYKPPAAAPTIDPNATAETMKRVGPMTAPKFADPRMPAGLPGALAQADPAATDRPAPPIPGGPRPSAAQRPATPPIVPPTQAAEQPSASPFLAEAAAAAREKPAAPTPEGIIAEQNKLLPAGMQEAAMQKMFADQRARAEGRQAAYDKSKPSGLDDLIRVFGQAGQYKGMSGMGPAYTSLQQQRRAEDMAMQKQQDELMTAIEGRQYGADEKMFGARKEAMSAANKSFQDRLMTNTKSLADLAGVDQRRMDEALNRLSQEKLERLRITARAAEASRPGEAERIEAKYMGMIAKGQPKEAEEYLSRISKIKGGAGIDRNPTPTDRLRAAQSIMNDIDSTAEEKAMAKKEIASIMAGNRAGGEGPTKTPITKAEYDKLPKGASYTAPDGTQRTKG
jgi:hypothetical protein